jgi:hypothetical protein
MKDAGSPEMTAKFERGPAGLMSVFPPGPPRMMVGLALWALFCLVISVFAAYLAGRTLAPGTHYLAVFRVVGAASFLAYGIGQLPTRSGGARPGDDLKHVADGLVYAGDRRHFRLALAA